MRTPLPGPMRVCKDCELIVPYPPAGLTRREELKRQHWRREKGLPAEYGIACLDSDGNSAIQCMKCAQEEYYRRNPHMRPRPRGSLGGSPDA